MTNETMIINAALQQELFTPEEVQEYLNSGRRLPLHTYAEWAALGYQVRRGEHAALKMQLWKPRKKKRGEQDDEQPDASESSTGFFLANASLFLGSQVERKQPA